MIKQKKRKWERKDSREKRNRRQKTSSKIQKSTNGYFASICASADVKKLRLVFSNPLVGNTL